MSRLFHTKTVHSQTQNCTAVVKKCAKIAENSARDAEWSATYLSTALGPKQKTRVFSSLEKERKSLNHAQDGPEMSFLDPIASLRSAGRCKRCPANFVGTRLNESYAGAAKNDQVQRKRERCPFLSAERSDKIRWTNRSRVILVMPCTGGA